MKKALLAALLLSALLPATAAASGLIDNVNGLALDEKGGIVSFSALLIDADGKVEKLIKGRDKRPEKLDFRLDGKGRTLIPGFVDAHAHVIELGLTKITLDLSNTSSLAEAQARIAAYIAENPGRKWIVGTGWNQERWGLGRFPTAAELDAVAPAIPVWLKRVDGHAGWANSAAMRAAGVSAATKAPPGGRMEMAGGTPSGIFVDAAMALIQRVVPPPAPKDRDMALEMAQRARLAQGVTAVTDMGTTLEDWQTFRRAGDRGALRIRIAAYAAGIDNMVAIAGPEPTPWLYDDRLRLGGVKFSIDGALGSRGAWLKADYADAPGQRGLPLTGSTQLRNQMSRAAMDGFQIALHAIGDEANLEALDAIAELAATYKGDRRWRIEHAQIVDPADLPRFGALGVVASMQPVHQTSDWRMAAARLGEARLTGAYAWRSMLDSKASLAFGSDTPVESANPFPGIAAAMTREDGGNQPFGGWQPQQRIGLEQALLAYTRGAAHAAFAEKRFGMLAVGQRADFLIIDRDIFSSRPADIRDARVLETWVGGKRIYAKE